MMMMTLSPFPIESDIRSPPKSESSAPDTTNGLRIHVRMSAEMTMTMGLPHLHQKHTLKFLGFNLLTVFH